MRGSALLSGLPGVPSLVSSPSVLSLVVVLGAGCGRPNPGFGLAPEPAPGSSSGGTTEVSTSEPPPVTTSGETTSALTASTTDASTSTSTTTSGESSSTGAPEPTWPLDCPEPTRTRAGTAVADTFLLNFPEGGGKCFGVDAECADLSLGKVPTFTVYYTDSGDQVMPDQEYGGVFAARFAGPLMPLYDGMWPVPPEAFLGVEVVVTVARPNDTPWGDPVDFRVFRVGDALAPWEEGNNSVLALCGEGEPSFHCQSCVGDLEMPWKCMTPWGYPNGQLFTKDELVTTAQLVDDPGEGAELVIHVAEDWEWLLKDGMVLVPGPTELLEDRIVVRAREFEMGAAGPFIAVVHCPPDFG